MSVHQMPKRYIEIHKFVLKLDDAYLDREFLRATYKQRIDKHFTHIVQTNKVSQIVKAQTCTITQTHAYIDVVMEVFCHFWSVTAT